MGGVASSAVEKLIKARIPLQKIVLLDRYTRGFPDGPWLPVAYQPEALPS